MRLHNSRRGRIQAYTQLPTMSFQTKFIKIDRFFAIFFKSKEIRKKRWIFRKLFFVFHAMGTKIKLISTKHWQRRFFKEFRCSKHPEASCKMFAVCNINEFKRFLGFIESFPNLTNGTKRVQRETFFRANSVLYSDNDCIGCWINFEQRFD